MTSKPQTTVQETAVRMFQHLKGFLRSGNSLGILVSGKTGVGKSSLINSIYHGAKVAKEGDSVTPITEYIVSYSMSVDTPYIDEESDTTTILTAWDTPGFGDIFADEERDEKRIDALKFVLDKADVLLYCFDIRTRMTRDDVDGIVKITKAVHPDVWRKSVFVLTFCNKIEIPLSSLHTDLVSYFKSKLHEWDKLIRSVLINQAKVPEDIVQDISIVPFGYRGYSIPDRDDWYTPFWVEVFKKTRESGKPGLLRLTWPRLSCESGDKVPKDSFNQRSISNDTLSVNLFGNEKNVANLVRLGNIPEYSPEEEQSLSHPLQPPKLQSDSNDKESSNIQQSRELPEPVDDDQEHPPPSICSHDSVLPDLNPVGNTPTRNVAGEVGNIPRVNIQGSKTRKRLLQAGGSIGSVAVAGALVGLLIGIAGGPFGMGIGAAAGFVAGAGTGAGSVIAHTIKEHIDEKRTQQREH